MEQDRSSLLRPSEFACLQHQHTRLYTEIIQVIEPKQRYWARPVLLCESIELSSEGTGVMKTIYDVRSCSDLLWPRSLFQTVFDTELIPLLVHLHANSNAGDSVVAPWTQPLALARQKLHQFMQTLWQAYPTAF